MDNKLLLIDENHRVLCSIDESKELYEIIRKYINKYGEKGAISDVVWLKEQLLEDLGEKYTNEDIDHMCEDIHESSEGYKVSREKFDVELSKGRTKEDIFADEIVNATKDMSTVETIEYMNVLEETVQTANDELTRTIITKNGSLNQNPQLDGFLAEDYHANSFNMNAAANGSQYRARVLKPNGTTYAKDSVDIEIYDVKTGKVIKRYQSKYYKDAKSTANAFNKGNYDGQNKLAPSEQAGEIDAEPCLSAPDGTKSDPLTKAGAKGKQNQAQNGKDVSVDWNDYKTRDLARQVYKQAVKASVISASIGTGLDVVTKIINEDEINIEDEAKVALECGATAGVTTAIAGAIKVAAEKGRIRIIPPGTPADVCTCIAVTGVETIRIIQRLNNSECTLHEAIDEIETTMAASACGFMTSLKGMAAGAKLGIALGPVGSFVGGLVGGFVGHLAGRKVGEEITKTYQQIRNGLGNLFEKTKNTVEKITNSLLSTT